MQNERAERLRSELRDLQARELELLKRVALHDATGDTAVANGQQADRDSLASVQARIRATGDAVAEAENLSLTGDGTARP